MTNNTINDQVVLTNIFDTQYIRELIELNTLFLLRDTDPLLTYEYLY